MTKSHNVQFCLCSQWLVMNPVFVVFYREVVKTHNCYLSYILFCWIIIVNISSVMLRVMFPLYFTLTRVKERNVCALNCWEPVAERGSYCRFKCKESTNLSCWLFQYLTKTIIFPNVCKHKHKNCRSCFGCYDQILEENKLNYRHLSISSLS